MHFISSLVFNSEVSPCDEIITWLINWFKSGDGEFTFYDHNSAADSRPFLRPFLLKLFLRCAESDSIGKHLNRMIFAEGNLVTQLPTMVLVMDSHKVTTQ